MSQSLTIKIKNNTGSTLLSNKAVYVTGFDEDNQVPEVNLASSNNASKLPTIGIVIDDIPNNSIGTIKLNGILSGFNTSSAIINTKVYLGLNGDILFEDPSSNSGFIAQKIGVVLTVDNDNGQILFFPMEINEVYIHASTHHPGEIDDLELTHNELLNISEDQHHTKIHANTHSPSGDDSIDDTYLPRDGSVGMTGSLGVGTDSPSASAALEINSINKGFLLTPMTAIQASAITPTDGLLLYVNTINATFTSVGFWGYENGAWTKL